MPRRAGRRLRSRDLAFFPRGCIKGGGQAAARSPRDRRQRSGALEGPGAGRPIGSSFSRLVSRHDVNE